MSVILSGGTGLSWTDYQHSVDGANCMICFHNKINVSIDRLDTWQRCMRYRGNDARLIHAAGSTSRATFPLGSGYSSSLAWFGHRRGAINGTDAHPVVFRGSDWLIMQTKILESTTGGHRIRRLA